MAEPIADRSCDWCERDATVYVDGGEWLDKACPKHRHLCGKGVQLPMKEGRCLS